MYELFLFSFFNSLFDLGRVGIFILIISLVLFCTLVCLCLALFKMGYSLRKRSWIFCCYTGLVVFERWAESIIVENYSFTFLTISVCLMLCSLIFIIPEKTIKIKEEQRELARFFDSQVKAITQPTTVNYLVDSKTELSNCQDLLNKVQEKNSTTIKAQVKGEQPINCSQEIDFLNVKTILNKLGYYSISSQDKLIAKELENAIISAEENGLNDQLKQKINDGLGALLKIMSKYAI